MSTISSRSFLMTAVVTAGLAGVASAQTISVPTHVLRDGAVGAGVLPDNYTSPDTEVNLVNFIPLSDAPGTYSAVVYNTANDTIDLSSFIASTTCCERGAGQNLHVNGYSESGSPTGNLYLRGEPNVNNEGFGAHANWLVTLDLDAIRANHFAGTALPLQLEGDFGAWGGIGSTDPNAGVIQGAIYLDGQRIDSMGQTVANPEPVNQSFDETIASGRYLTFTILNGTGASPTLWDDGIYQDVTLTVVPEPAAMSLLGLGGLGLLARRRRA